jgi:hypothetical protein
MHAYAGRNEITNIRKSMTNDEIAFMIQYPPTRLTKLTPCTANFNEKSMKYYDTNLKLLDTSAKLESSFGQGQILGRI